MKKSFYNNEKYIIASLKTPRNINNKRLGKDYIDHFYTGEKDYMDRYGTGKREVVSYGMDWGYQKNLKNARKYKSKSYAEKVARKINYDCELGDTGNWLDVVPVSQIGKNIDFKR